MKNAELVRDVQRMESRYSARRNHLRCPGHAERISRQLLEGKPKVSRSRGCACTKWLNDLEKVLRRFSVRRWRRPVLERERNGKEWYLKDPSAKRWQEAIHANILQHWKTVPMNSFKLDRFITLKKLYNFKLKHLVGKILSLALLRERGVEHFS